MQGNKTASAKRRKVTFFRVALVLLLATVCAFAIFRLTLRSKLNARIEAIRVAGYPVTCAELDKWYTLPEGAENAAYAITDAFSYYVEPHYTQFVPIVGQAELPPRAEPLTEEMKGFVGLCIIDNKEALELLHAGAAMENCRYPVDLSAGYEARLHDLSSLKKGARLLNVEAIWHAGSRPGRSVRSVISSFGLAQSLESEPVLVSQLVRIACQALTVSTLERLVNRADLTDAQLDELSRAVVRAQAPMAMSRAFVGERCMGLAMLKMPPAQLARTFLLSSSSRESPAEVRMRSLIIYLHRFAGLTDRSTIIYLDMMEEYMEATQLPADQRHRAVEAIDARYGVESQTNFLLVHVTPAIARVDLINLRGIAGLQTARTALAIQRYRLAAGKLPDTLADLVPAYLDTVPKDPFDGHDLRYKKLEPGFVVYSINEDLSDDGGREKGPRKARGQKAHDWDMTFIVER